MFKDEVNGDGKAAAPEHTQSLSLGTLESNISIDSGCYVTAQKHPREGQKHDANLYLAIGLIMFVKAKEDVGR